MIPKKKRRLITVDGAKYEYCISGCVRVFIRNLATGETMEWWQDWKPKWKQTVTPKDIAELIHFKILYEHPALIGHNYGSYHAKLDELNTLRHQRLESRLSAERAKKPIASGQYDWITQDIIAAQIG